MAGSLASCADFLDRYPQDSVNNETYWKTEEQLRAALYPCYEAFHKDLLINMSEATAETCMWGDITSGLSKVSGGKHSYTDGFPFTTYWARIYASIFNCNNFLDNYNKAEMPQDDKDVYAAEVKVIRAYMYFLLTTFWGDTPWIDHVITADEAYVPRDPRSKVIDNVISDLQWAASKLPEERQLGDNVGRIDRWGALAMLARVALQNERYDIAISASKEIIDHGPYDLWDYAKVYQTEGDVETNPANIESIIFSLYVPDIRIHNVSNETCCPVDYIRLNASKSLVDAYLCTDGKPAKAGLEYYHNNNIVTSDLYKFPEEHYADYFQNRDPHLIFGQLKRRGRAHESAPNDDYILHKQNLNSLPDRHKKERTTPLEKRAALPRQDGMQGGDVAEPHHPLGLAEQGAEVQTVEDAHQPVTAPGAQDEEARLYLAREAGVVLEQCDGYFVGDDKVDGEVEFGEFVVGHGS